MRSKPEKTTDYTTENQEHVTRMYATGTAHTCSNHRVRCAPATMKVDDIKAALKQSTGIRSAGNDYVRSLLG